MVQARIEQGNMLTSKIAALSAAVAFAASGLSFAQMPMSQGMHGMRGMCGGCEEMHRAMMGGMKSMEMMQSTGDSDRDFAAMMKMHHQGAINLAEAQLKNGKDPDMLATAKRMIEAKKKEIRELEEWLRKAK